MDACSLRQDQQRGRARWWRSRLCSETGGSEQGRYILRHSAVGRLTAARISHESGSDNMIDPAEANETYRAASAIAAFDAIQVAPQPRPPPGGRGLFPFA